MSVGVPTQCFRVAGQTESGPTALQGFCVLNSLLTSLSRMERVVVMVFGEDEGLRASRLCSGPAPAEVGELEIIAGVRGDVSGLSYCLSNRQ